MARHYDPDNPDPRLIGREVLRDLDVPDVVEGTIGKTTERSIGNGKTIWFIDILSSDGQRAWVEVMVYLERDTRVLLLDEGSVVYRFRVTQPTSAERDARAGGLRPRVTILAEVSAEAAKS